jgi:hypothetical protein
MPNICTLSKPERRNRECRQEFVGKFSEPIMRTRYSDTRSKHRIINHTMSKKSGLILAAIVVLVVVAIYIYKKPHLLKRAEGLAGSRGAGRGVQARGRRAARGKSRFTSDIDDWPSAMQVGAMADTFPYGNYAGGTYVPPYN